MRVICSLNAKTNKKNVIWFSERREKKREKMLNEKTGESYFTDTVSVKSGMELFPRFLIRLFNQITQKCSNANFLCRNKLVR